MERVARHRLALLALVGASTAVGPAAAAGSSTAPKPPAAPRAAAAPGDVRTRIGFTFHWDFFERAEDADRLLEFALANGAEVLNVVPPAHIWEQPESLAILRRVFAVTRKAGVKVVLNRIDGSLLAPSKETRANWLYTHVLDQVGRMPSGRPTSDLFLATVGNPEYERWLREETVFYAENFSGEPNLLAFGVGLFNEPFVSQRGGLLCFDRGANSYEVSQYTPYATSVWHAWLRRAFNGELAALNAAYSGRFAAIDLVPLPKNDTDPAFGSPAPAYLDFVTAINAWVVAQLDGCRSLWHAHAHADVPFMLQFSGYLPEKFAKGRPAFAALDIFDWMVRADALGLSLYTNCEYPDWGHASDAAMVNFLRVGALLGKPVFVLECGSECDGAVLEKRELKFIASSARRLAPVTAIYEFLKTSTFEHFATSTGKLLGDDWRARRSATRVVRRALESVQEPAGETVPTFVLDDPLRRPAGGGRDGEVLDVRRRLMRLAMVRALTFVPETCVDRLPRNSRLLVESTRALARLRRRLAPRGIAVDSAADFLGAGEGADAPPPR